MEAKRKDEQNEPWKQKLLKVEETRETRHFETAVRQKERVKEGDETDHELCGSEMKADEWED